MINYLKGTLTSKIYNGPQGSNVTVEVNGIGYLVNVTSRVIKDLPELDTEIKIFTSLIHKEDSMTLCGFSKREDRDLFNILLSVSGVGTKVSLLLLDTMNAIELTQAVINEDTKALSQAKGVGPKLAKRLVLELKDKMTSWAKESDIDFEQETITSPEIKTDAYAEAKSVLLSLGYTQNEVSKGLTVAIEKEGTEANSEELLKVALETISF